MVSIDSLPKGKLGIRKRQPLREGCLFCLIRKCITKFYNTYFKSVFNIAY